MSIYCVQIIYLYITSFICDYFANKKGEKKKSQFSCKLRISAMEKLTKHIVYSVMILICTVFFSWSHFKRVRYMLNLKKTYLYIWYIRRVEQTILLDLFVFAYYDEKEKKRYSRRIFLCCIENHILFAYISSKVSNIELLCLAFDCRLSSNKPIFYGYDQHINPYVHEYIKCVNWGEKHSVVTLHVHNVYENV